MNHTFRDEVYHLVATIPSGRVMTYGQVAAYCNRPGAARVVGQIAHFGALELPWHRVVNYRGGMAGGYVPGGRSGQAELLIYEGVIVNDGLLNLQEYIWSPSD